MYQQAPYQYIINDTWESFTATVPGIGEAADGQTHELVATENSTILIEVGSNIKITISAS